MIQWYTAVFRKYAVFEGRSGRSEYWWFALCNALVEFALYFVAGLAIAVLGNAAKVLSVFPAIYVFAALVPSIAVTVRRLHDTGRSGWWILISLVPVVGVIVLLVFLALESSPGDNRFGPNPRAEILAPAPTS